MTTAPTVPPSVEIQTPVGNGHTDAMARKSRARSQQEDEKSITYQLATSQGCAKLTNENVASARDVALARCDCLLERYLHWKRNNLIKSNAAQAAVICLTAAIPVVMLVPTVGGDTVKMIGGGLSALAAIAAGALAHYNWRDEFIRYGYTYHALQNEKYNFLTRAIDSYNCENDTENVRRFARRVEEIALAEVNDWRSQMEKEAGQQATVP